MLYKVLLKACEVWSVCQTFSQSEFVACYLPTQELWKPLNIFFPCRTQMFSRSFTCCKNKLLCQTLLVYCLGWSTLISVSQAVFFLSWKKNSHILWVKWEKTHNHCLHYLLGKRKKMHWAVLRECLA